MIDFSTLKELYVDGKKVTSLFLDGHEVPVGGIDPTLYETTLVFRTLEASVQPFQIALSARGTPPDVGLEWSTDGRTWTEMSKDYTNPASIPNQTAGTEVFVRASKVNAGFGVAGQPWEWRFWTANATYELAGNMKYLLDSEGGIEDLSSGGFPELFSYNPGLAGFDDLSIGVSAVEQDACWGMFRECSNLVDARGLKLDSIISVSSNGFMQAFQGCRNMVYAPAIPNVSYTTNSLQSMFSNCSKLSHVDSYLTGLSWTNACRSWLTNVSSNGVMICNSSLGNDSTISRSSSACPSNWLVGNYDVDGHDMQNAFTRGSYTTAFIYDGQAHQPDMSQLSVFNGQTAAKLLYMTDYTIQYSQDATSVGTKTIEIQGIGEYSDATQLEYLIVDANIANCTIELETAYDNEGPTSLKVWNAQLQQYLTENVDYTWTYVDSTDTCTVTVTGAGLWHGTKTATVARKDSGTTPLAIYKHDSNDSNNVYVKLANNGGPTVAIEKKPMSDPTASWTELGSSYASDSVGFWLRAKNENGRTAINDNQYNWIDCGYDQNDAAQVDISGNMVSLLDRSETISSASVDSVLNSIFENNDKIVDASKLSCSIKMFNSSYGIRRWFGGRGSGYGALAGRPQALTAMPPLEGLSVNTRYLYSYVGNFQNCTSLLSVEWHLPWPVNPDNKWPDGNHLGESQFRDCTQLKDVVIRTHFGDGRLCEDSLTSQARFFRETFQGCTSLTCISTDISIWPTNGFPSWVQGVSATGTFYCPTALGTDATIRRGTSYCPVGWTVVNI